MEIWKQNLELETVDVDKINENTKTYWKHLLYY